MRSRFSAFYLQDADYLCRTHAKAARGENEKEELLASFQQTQWLGLQIIETVEGNKNESEGWVEFVASYCSGLAPALSQAHPISELDIGRQAIQQLREKSYFHREEGNWVYASGTIKKTSPPGRNDPCWCGSGKKLKKCHPPA
ncbi:MAG: SEC-C domain-containing protein [Pseudomonadales bacterium]|nr:SEC-C domain-containing protein [Pseudomonadales bacterium]